LHGVSPRVEKIAPISSPLLAHSDRILSFKPALRLERRGQDSQEEIEQREHSPPTLSDSVSQTMRIRFSVHTDPEVGQINHYVQTCCRFSGSSFGRFDCLSGSPWRQD